MRVSGLSLSIALLLGLCGTMHGQTLRFTEPTKTQMQGTVDLEVAAPADTTAVRFYLDGTQLSELTDEYAIATKTKPIWHTVMAAEYFAPGTHQLSAVATTTNGTVRASMAVTIVNPSSPHVLSLDGSWRFVAAEDLPLGEMEGTVPAVVEPAYRDATWTKVVVPNSIDAVDSRWMHPGGLLGTYRRMVVLSGKHPGELYLRMESCFWSCRVFVNGIQVGTSVGGYLPRRFDVNAYVHPGLNTVAVIVDSRPATMGVFQKLRYYYWNYTGILQDIVLEELPVAGITEVRVQGTAAGALEIRPLTVNSGNTGKTVEASIRVVAPDGQTVLSAKHSIEIPAKGGETTPIRLQVENPKLWDLDHPNLYTVFVSTHGSQVEEKTGFRDIVVRNGDLLLNDKPVLGLQGFDRHADYPGLGRSQPDELADREIKMLHDKGFRIFRPAHYPTTKAELDAADKYGLLVLEEINVTGFSGTQLAEPTTIAFAKEQMQRMIARDRSHPSIFAWSVGNENRTDQPGSPVYVHDVIHYGKTLDATRPFTEVSAQLRHDICYGEMDFLAVNIYAGWYTDNLSDVVPELDALGAYAGNKPMVITEYGAEAVIGRPGLGKGTEYFQALTIDAHNRLLRNRPHFIGKMYWTSTELVVGPKWDGGNPDPVPPFHTKALLTYFRQPKLGWRVMFSPVEMDTLAPINAEASLPFSKQIEVVLHNREGHEVSGRFVITPPKGATASVAEVPFHLAANGTTKMTFNLNVTTRVKGKNTYGMARAVMDADTEAMPELLQIQDMK